MEGFWGELGAIGGMWSDPWCVVGDFNMIKFPFKRSRGGRLSSAMRRFLEVIEDLELRDLPLQGGHFTWSGGLNNQSKSRIDRFLVSEDWEGLRRGPTPFRFENMWLKEEDFKTVPKTWWEGFNFSGSASFILAEKLKALKTYYEKLE
ncbi:hypothetical protein CK203_072745 [Vitis vinifera]|uniref:Endonuclease/exonuclease/phosphatase domain-containing protein n=1 Tax=Vitis vinifera TaxID=29760 RepID=A0A438EZ44_VITVI|nr:hypothetical protein CK203_072745 [Vitis vinifera]